jgi:hypothetical protein
LPLSAVSTLCCVFHTVQQIRQHLMPKRLRVLVLGSASAIAAGTDAAGSSGIKASSSSAASGA